MVMLYRKLRYADEAPENFLGPAGHAMRHCHNIIGEKSFVPAKKYA